MTDLIVIGAGPAGIAAALRASALGLRVVLLDDQPQAGGQVHRAPAGTRPVPPSPEARTGTVLRDGLAGSAVEARPGHQVWSVSADFRVDALGPEGPCHWQAPALIVATGAQERVMPFPGWTLPGVVGLAAATLLLKAHGIAPGARTLVAGCGPLLGAVAAGILKAGGQVAAVADLAAPADWARRLPAMAARPDLLARGAGWAARLRRAGVPLLFRTTVAEVEATATGLRARLCPVDADGRPRPGGTVVEADAVAVGHGLLPSTEITRLLRVEHAFDAVAGNWAARLDGDGRSSRRGLYVAGDGGGIQGAAAAPLRGELAALAAARDLGRLDAGAQDRLAAPLRRRLARAARFGRAMAGLMAPRPGQVEAITPGAVVCRCEDVTRAEIEAAAAEGAREVNQLKAWTRCGMGPCQGRVCGDTAAALLARHHGIAREEAGLFTGRTPLRPLPLAQLTGEFGYADIVLPPPAPL
ncbi:NAD(P)/FAD-dependent oxidoreductase [Roseomonas sp. KE0001]|uniref:FAD/NAD(P)-dependent oxidoreductase n=1 Tax=Roseomonas sp. KE0001 TaxID=2479201 RepID=UPI0018DF8872|nr:NAD(P)/FAD-dependent oxidoreductase [Roseomonas sp. KE0001]MBI0436101.1 FAD-dependent oxidoreductase [Roseomonas sp. KE0001]